MFGEVGAGAGGGAAASRQGQRTSPVQAVRVKVGVIDAAGYGSSGIYAYKSCDLVNRDYG